MKRLLFLCCLLCLLLCALPLYAETQPSPQLLDTLEKNAGSVRTLSSDFVQEKHLSMFKNPMTSKGRLYFSKPDQLRWELTAPVASGFVLKGDRGRRWHERTGRTESFQISQEPIMKLVSEQLFAWARSDFAWIKKEYRVTVLQESPALLRLEPRSAATAGFLHHLLIGFSADGRYVKSVELHEKDGDFTRIRFLNTAVNKALPADIF
ncbi:outer membrane lipoprotein carrier protein LolA [Geomonas paludis]|uniref:Outer membrane lipoprotein carrier protein LolA n=1 Tax=Geomonas paludis TaxID=2740185 RepID=A0A6V8MSE0_9BACT|nr:outer membrane lipoprotein carrier protein LolA [Geomonas paludis]UPU36049.1 outer membrane lipoprotein carrier protein LolA [Geomonas paludis]GFO62359.1 outer-membrane lipoprotein carrier protein [Geomonas paludis]